jgi:hypothetical protein
MGCVISKDYSIIGNNEATKSLILHFIDNYCDIDKAHFMPFTEFMVAFYDYVETIIHKENDERLKALFNRPWYHYFYVCDVLKMLKNIEKDEHNSRFSIKGFILRDQDYSFVYLHGIRLKK